MSTMFAGLGGLLFSGVVGAIILYLEAEREPRSNRLRRKAKRAIKSSPVARTIARKLDLSDRTVFDKIQDAYSEERNNIKTLIGRDPSDIRKMAGKDVLRELRTIGKELRTGKKKRSKNKRKIKKKTRKNKSKKR